MGAIPSDGTSALFDSVMNRLFSSGLTLASVLRGQTVGDEVHQRLSAVIAHLDTALGELRTAALANAVLHREARADGEQCGAVTPIGGRAGARSHATASRRADAYGVAGFTRPLWRESET